MALLLFTCSISLIGNAPASARPVIHSWSVFGDSYKSFGLSGFTKPIVLSGGESVSTYASVLPACDSLRSAGHLPEDCILGLSIQDTQGGWVSGVFKQYVPISLEVEPTADTPAGSISFQQFFTKGGIDVAPDASHRIHGGARTSIWTFPGIRHDGGEDFAVTFAINVPLYNGKARTDEALSTIKVSPVRITSNLTEEILRQRVSALNLRRDNEQCAVNGNSRFCAEFMSFPKPMRIRIEAALQVNRDAFDSTTWMTGYGINPAVTQVPMDDGSSSTRFTFEVSSVAIQIPRIVLASDSELNEYIDMLAPEPPLKMIPAQREVALNLRAELRRNYFSDRPSEFVQSSVALDATNLLGKQERFLGASGKVSEFSGIEFLTLRTTNLGKYSLFRLLQSCPRDSRLGGLVATNATATEPGPPNLDVASQTLLYRVAAPHLRADGELNQGNYNLYLSPQVSQCIWGKDLQGAKAEVSIIGDGGNIQIASSAFRNDESGVKFDVFGFHYSAGSIQVGLKKAEPSASKKKSAITCVRAGSKRVVRGWDPKCPKGYRVKG